jgi:uncharacterized protein with PIN domain
LGLRVRVGNRARIRARAGAKVWVRVTSSPGNIARVARRPRPRVGWSNASNGGGAVAAAAASLLALRELVDGILAQCLSTARQLDRLQMHADLSKVRLKRVSRRTASSALWHVGCGRTKSARLGFEACMAYCSDDDECDAAETDDEVEVRLSGLRYGSRDSGEVGGGQLRGRAV